MIEIKRTTSQNEDFKKLVNLLDADLADRDGKEHAFYAQFNKIHSLNQVVVLYQNKIPVSCGAIKTFEDKSVEIKRMYTLPSHRGQGLATLVLKELQQWAFELSFSHCVLETGIKQPEAIKLYLKNGYQQIENYGQYKGIANSLCFKKMLS